MAIPIRNLPDAVSYALVAANNQRITDSIGSSFHRAQTESVSADYRNPVITRLRVTAANASDLATSVTLVNAIKAAMNLHFADDLAHNTALSSAVATADATDLATGITLGNALKSALNTHLTASNVHFNNDGTNSVAATNASDQSTLNTLLNEMKGDINAHIAGAPAGSWIKIVSA